MSYTRLTDFASKDALLSGNPAKVIRGTEIDAEFAALEATDALNAKTGTGVSFSSITDTGNLTFTGTANRVTGDFSNATVANRVTFQTSTLNSGTIVSAIPNGSALNAHFRSYGNSDPTNASFLGIRTYGVTEARVESGIEGSGTYLPMTFYTGGSETMRIDAGGNVTVTNATGGLGYGVGAGGTVTQATSRTTAVTLNKPTGQITMFTAAGSASWQAFIVNNSLVTVNDTVVASVIVGATNIYSIIVGGVNAGSFVIYFNAVSGTASDTPVINFAIIKGSAS